MESLQLRLEVLEVTLVLSKLALLLPVMTVLLRLHRPLEMREEVPAARDNLT